MAQNFSDVFSIIYSANPGSPDYRRQSNPQNPRNEGPQAYNVLDIYLEKVWYIWILVTYNTPLE